MLAWIYEYAAENEEWTNFTQVLHWWMTYSDQDHGRGEGWEPRKMESWDKINFMEKMFSKGKGWVKKLGRKRIGRRKYLGGEKIG